MLLLGMLWVTMPDEVKKAEEPKASVTEADKDWIDTQVGQELEKRGLKVFVTWTPSINKDANGIIWKIGGIIVAESKEEAEGILKERK
jgi:hypothetical protein